MRKMALFIMVISCLISCGIFKQYKSKSWNEDYELNIKYIPERDSGKVLLKICINDDYDLLIPIENVIEFTTVSDDSKEMLKIHMKNIEPNIEYSKNIKLRIIKTDLINFVMLRKVELFKSGNYFIQNKKEGYLIDKIRIKDEGAYSDPLAAYGNFEVYIDNILIWDYGFQA